VVIEQFILFLGQKREESKENRLFNFTNQAIYNNIYEIDPLHEILIDETPLLKTIYYFAAKNRSFPTTTFVLTLFPCLPATKLTILLVRLVYLPLFK